MPEPCWYCTGHRWEVRRIACCEGLPGGIRKTLTARPPVLQYFGCAAWGKQQCLLLLAALRKPTPGRRRWIIGYDVDSFLDFNEVGVGYA